MQVLVSLPHFLAGTLADRIGRKVVMIFSLAMMGIAYFFLMRADAMPADMLPSEQRIDVYAINRIANNSAFAVRLAVSGVSHALFRR